MPRVTVRNPGALAQVVVAAMGGDVAAYWEAVERMERLSPRTRRRYGAWSPIDFVRFRPDLPPARRAPRARSFGTRRPQRRRTAASSRGSPGSRSDDPEPEPVARADGGRR